MGIQRNNIVVDVNTIVGASAIIRAFTVKLFDMISECDANLDRSGAFIHDTSVIDLEDNLVGEMCIKGKRGGANRLRVFINKRNGAYGISIRYGNNIVHHDIALSIGHDITVNVQDIAKDGKSESRIQFMVQRGVDYISRLDRAINPDKYTDDTAPIIASASVTA